MAHPVLNAKHTVQNPTAILMSFQKIQEDELHIVTQNLSNASHPGYKAFLNQITAQEYKAKNGKKISYVKTAGMARDVSAGSFRVTNDPFHLSLSSGYFVIQTTNGKRFTKNGQFMVNEKGELSTHQGYPVLDENDTVITFSDPSKSFKILENGTIMMGDEKRSRIGVVMFQDEQNMLFEGNSLLDTDQEAIPLQDAKVLQGGFEESNVSPFECSLQLMKILHSFEEAHNMIKNYEQLQRETMNAKSSIA